MSQPILQIENLVTTFPCEGDRLGVVDGISFSIAEGEILALVGESGCGKSVTALSAMRLVPRPGRIETGSTIVLDGKDLLRLSVPQMRRVRGAEMAMIFQEPMTSLNPVQGVGRQVVEGIRLHERLSMRAARERVLSLFERVGIPDPGARFSAYPHQLSGGLKQRVMIAMALAMRPKCLIADEPTTALDVTVQAEILDLLRELQRDLGTAILLITHDLGVVNELADRVTVMYAGKIVERGTRLDILHEPRHPYTKGLLHSIPGRGQQGERLAEIAGAVPQPSEWPKGCRFSTRCSEVFSPCIDTDPEAICLGSTHSACCHAVAREVAP